jgi:hypothetical protein
MNQACITLEKRVAKLEERVENLWQEVEGIRTGVARIVSLCEEIKTAVGLKPRSWWPWRK